MFARLPRILIALALAGSIGIHWAFLQAVAWTGMIVTYAQQAPLGEAVAKTFDGQHPCNLCKQIANGKKSERKSDYKMVLSKLEFPCAPDKMIVRGPSAFSELRSSHDAAEVLPHTPPSPPPRAIAG